MNPIIDLIKSNSLLVAGVGTVLFGALMYLAKSVPLGAYRLAKRLLTVELVLTSEHHLYHDVMDVLSRSRLQAFARIFTVSTRGGVVAGYGTSLALWRGRIVVFTRSILEKDYRLYEKLEVTLLSRRVDLLEAIVHAAQQPPLEPTIKVYQGNGGYFGEHVRKAKRPLATVFCSGDTIAEIKGRIDWFLANEQFYLRRGIPYKLVVLLHGKPGCGKSSLIFALASEFNRNLGVIGSMLNLGRTFVNAPDNSFLVIEDIDMLTVSREGDEEKAKTTEDARQGGAPLPQRPDQSFALSALHVLINTLDGLGTPHGLILFVTTNFKERLDAALIRKGRIDLDCEIGLLDAEAAGDMFEAFYDAAARKAAGSFLREPEFRPMSGADLQDIFTTEKNPQVAAIRLARRSDLYVVKA